MALRLAARQKEGDERTTTGTGDDDDDDVADDGESSCPIVRAQRFRFLLRPSVEFIRGKRPKENRPPRELRSPKDDVVRRNNNNNYIDSNDISCHEPSRIYMQDI